MKELKEKLSTNVGVYSILASLWTSFFSSCSSQLSDLSYFSYHCQGNCSKLIECYMRKEQDKKIKIKFADFF